MRENIATRSIRLLLVVVALLASAVSASAQIKPGAGDPYAPRVMAEGKGWKLFATFDPDRGERQEGHPVWMVMRGAVANLPVSQGQRDALEASFGELADADSGEVFFVDAEALEQLEAGTLPADPDAAEGEHPRHLHRPHPAVGPGESPLRVRGVPAQPDLLLRTADLVAVQDGPRRRRRRHQRRRGPLGLGLDRR